MTTETAITAEDFSALVDRSRWQRGPWDTEADLLRFESHGLPCLILRHRGSGHLCGYVAVPPGHPWHGVDFSSFADRDYSRDPEVHGGVTFAERCAGFVCHVPKPGEPADVWWLGFDAAHHGDAGPSDRSWRSGGAYRDIDYMRAECESLAEQARKAA
jgi:hypothetical protein